jgi:hypothetical protein
MFRLTVLVFLFLIPELIVAQVYRRSAGIRMDESSFGLSLVQRIAKPVTIEGIADFRKQDISLALVPRIHGKILGRRLNYFIGAGAQAGIVKISSQKLQPFWGVGGMIGLEYKFNLLPIHISYDFRPLVQLDGHPDLLGFQSAFAIRLVRKSERKEWKEKLKKWKDDVFGDDED